VDIKNERGGGEKPLLPPWKLKRREERLLPPHAVEVENEGGGREQPLLMRWTLRERGGQKPLLQLWKLKRREEEQGRSPSSRRGS